MSTKSVTITMTWCDRCGRDTKGAWMAKELDLVIKHATQSQAIHIGDLCNGCFNDFQASVREFAEQYRTAIKSNEAKMRDLELNSHATKL